MSRYRGLSEQEQEDERYYEECARAAGEDKQENEWDKERREYLEYKAMGDAIFGWVVMLLFGALALLYLLLELRLI